MKKFIIFSVILFFGLNIATAENIDNSIDSFVNSPSAEDIANIQDPHLRFCEEIFLKAYMRREFTKEENNQCRDIFSMKIEAELNYKINALKERDVY